MAARDLFIRRLIFDPKYGAIAQFVREIPTNPTIREVRVNRFIIPKKVLALFLRSRLPTYNKYRNDNELLLKIDQNRATDKNLLWFTFSPNQILSDKVVAGFAKAINLPLEQLNQPNTPLTPVAAVQPTQTSPTAPIQTSHPSSPPIHHPPQTTRARVGEVPPVYIPLEPPSRLPQPEQPFFEPTIPPPEPVQSAPSPAAETVESIAPIEEVSLPPQTEELPIETDVSSAPLPMLRLPSFAKDLASNFKIAVRRVATKPIVQQSVVAGLGGGAAGIATFGLPGGVVGGAIGSILPSFAKMGGFKAIGGFGGKALAGGAAKAGLMAAGIATGPPGWIATAAALAPNLTKPIIKRASKTALITILMIVGFIVLAVLIPTGGLNFIQNNSLFPPFSVETGTGTTATTQNRVEVVKSGTKETANGWSIEYTISITYIGSGKANLTVTDALPKTVAYVGSSDQGQVDESGKVSWTLTGLSSGAKKDLTLTVQALPEADDSYVVNQAKATVISIAGLPSSSKIIDVKSLTLNELFFSAAKNAGIPLAFLKAIATVETPTIFRYSDEEVKYFSTPNWWINLPEGDPTRIRGYAYNTCANPALRCLQNDVRGPMQFEIKSWNGIKGQLVFADGHIPERENLSDAIYGSALFNKQNAVQYAKVTGDSDWDEATVRKVARIYCAGPSENVDNAACVAGGRTHDDLTWEYYQYFLTLQE